MRTKARRRTNMAANPVEVIFVALMLACVVMLWPRPIRAPYFVLCGLVGLVCGAVSGLVSRTNQIKSIAGLREFEDFQGDKKLSLWRLWLNWSRAVVDYEFRLLLVACYIVLVAPIALAFRRRAKQSTQDMKSAWIPRSTTASMDTARRPF